MTDNDKARDIRSKICEIVSEMLDNPTGGIYSTSRCFDRLEGLFESQRLALEEKDMENQRLQSRIKVLETMLDSQGITINEQSR